MALYNEYIEFTTHADVIGRKTEKINISQNFIGDQYICRNDKLQEANRNGELDKILKGE